MIFTPTRIIANAFEERELHFSLEEATIANNNYSILHCSINIDCGPTVMCSFISDSDNSDVAIRVLGLLNGTPPAKQKKMIEACNHLTGKCRYGKFYMDSSGDVHVEYDLPPFMDDDYVADACFHVYMLLANTLCKNYRTLAKVMYSDDEEEPRPSPAFAKFLKDIFSLRKTPIVLDENDQVIAPDPRIEDDDFSNWPELLHEKIKQELEQAANKEYGLDEDLDD